MTLNKPYINKNGYKIACSYIKYTGDIFEYNEINIQFSSYMRTAFCGCSD